MEYQDELNYLVKLVENSDTIDWQKAVNDLGIEINKDSLRKAFNTTKFSGYNVYRFMKDKQTKNLSTDEIDQLNKAKDELYKERVKIQDANREKRQMLRNYSRVENLMEYIDKQMNAKKPLQMDYHFESFNHSVQTKEATALVSDLHCGATVNSVFNQYDIDVLKNRMDELSDKIINRCKEQNVNLLHIALLGDFITGVIHGSTIAQAQEDVIDQVIDASNILEGFIKKIAEYIPEVRVYVVYGNHGRTAQSKNDRAYRENFERLVTVILRKDFRESNVKVLDNGYEDFVLYTLRDGKNIVVTHGTNDMPSTANKNFSKMLGKDIYRVYMGHYHDVKESNGTLVNGSVMGSDDYSISKRLDAKPTQLLEVYDGDDCVTYRMILK